MALRLYIQQSLIIAATKLMEFNKQIKSLVINSKYGTHILLLLPGGIWTYILYVYSMTTVHVQYSAKVWLIANDSTLR